MQEQTLVETCRLELVDCFAKATWIALGFAFVCLSIDAFAIFGYSHHATSLGRTRGGTVFTVALWALEILLALLALWLVRFAFSRPPRFLRET
jgi:hypothetical protein